VTPVRVADYIFRRIADEAIEHVFFVPGGGAMHLNNGLLHEPRLTAVSMLHEQGAAIAAETYARTSARFGVASVTSGPGVTNALTGVAGAWLESTPTLTISGQVKRADLRGDSGVRQLGVQELDAVAIVSPITKYAVCLMDPDRVRYELEKCLHLMRSGRTGPVWLEVPMDVQASEIDPDQLPGFAPAPQASTELSDATVDRVAELLRASVRPVILAGNGVHAAAAEGALRALIETAGLPTLTTWIAADLLEFDSPYYVGRCGTAAPRGPNFAVQNADLVLSIGCRMDFSITGFDRTQFARAADVVVVDIDASEIAKLGDLPALGVVSDAKRFLDALLQRIPSEPLPIDDWRARCERWKTAYPVVLPEYRAQTEYVNSYVFAETLCDEMAEGDVLVPGSSGAALDTFWLTARLKRGQRSLPTGSLGAMGYGLPATIGACLGAGVQRTVSVDGDGGFVMNIQELEVVRRLRLPIKYFVLNNDGYASIRSSQSGYFGEVIGADQRSGLTLPDITSVARSFGIATVRVDSQVELRSVVRNALRVDGPIVCEVMVNPEQAIGPRVATRLAGDGRMVSTPLEDLSPFLDRDELAENMIIPLIDEPS
jgi:acetolactate synthase-1/2/3 large subunit